MKRINSQETQSLSPGAAASGADAWKVDFRDRLARAQTACTEKFESVIEKIVLPIYDDLCPFLRDNGFSVSMPLHENGRRSFKFELAENAYVLVIFRFFGVGEFELRNEIFAPGGEPVSRKNVGRVQDITPAWTEQQFRQCLDQFVGLLGRSENRTEPVAREPELVHA